LDREFCSGTCRFSLWKGGGGRYHTEGLCGEEAASRGGAPKLCPSLPLVGQTAALSHQLLEKYLYKG